LLFQNRRLMLFSINERIKSSARTAVFFFSAAGQILLFIQQMVL